MWSTGRARGIRSKLAYLVASAYVLLHIGPTTKNAEKAPPLRVFGYWRQQRDWLLERLRLPFEPRVAVPAVTESWSTMSIGPEMRLGPLALISILTSAILLPSSVGLRGIEVVSHGPYAGQSGSASGSLVQGGVSATAQCDISSPFGNSVVVAVLVYDVDRRSGPRRLASATDDAVARPRRCGPTDEDRGSRETVGRPLALISILTSAILLPSSVGLRGPPWDIPTSQDHRARSRSASPPKPRGSIPRAHMPVNLGDDVRSREIAGDLQGLLIGRLLLQGGGLGWGRSLS